MSVVDLAVEVTPFATVGDLMGGQPTPTRWRPLARRRWFRLLDWRIECELKHHMAFTETINESMADLQDVRKMFAKRNAVRKADEKQCAVSQPDLDEILHAYRHASNALHELWTAHVGTPGYHKAAWRELANALDRLGRDAATLAGHPRTDPLP